MALIDSIISAESGGNPNARNPRSSAMGAHNLSLYVREKLGADLLICKLLFARGPAAVLGRVVPIVVNAIKRVFLAWPRSHVGKEVLKAIPAFANLNAPRSVVFVGDVLGEGASAAHPVPNLVFGGGLASSISRYGHAVRSVGSAGIARGTPATGRISRPQVRQRHNLFGAAIAYAKHSADSGVSIFTDLWGGLGGYRKSSKPRADAVYGGCHRWAS